MKKLKWLGSVLLAMVMALGMVACGGDDNGENGGGGRGATGWEGDWLIMATSDFVNYPAYIQVLTLDRASGRFYSTYLYTEDGELVGGSIAYGSLLVNEQNSTMTLNGVTGDYEVDGDEITFFGSNTSVTYKRLNAEQKAIFAKWKVMSQGYVFPYEIEPGSGGVIPGGGVVPGGGGSGTGGNIVGSWYDYYTEDGYYIYDIYTFSSNGMLTCTLLYSKDKSTWYKDDYDSFYYKTSGNTITVTKGSETFKSPYSVNGNTLVLDGDTFYKVTSEIQRIWNSAISDS